MNTQCSIIPFAFDDALVRAHLDENGNPWFVAKDVCRVLEIENNRDAISNLDDDEKITVANTDGNPRAGVPHQMAFVSESGLYSLVFRSRKPEAKRFRKWVTSEVLPTLRKTGTYIMPEAAPQRTRQYAMPDIPEMYALRPSMRQRLWSDALQTARLDNAGAEVAGQWFVELCRMMTAGYSPVTRPEEETRRIFQFADEKCTPNAHTRLNASTLFDAFQTWWCNHFDEPVPSHNVFGRTFATRFAKCKRGGKTVYFGVAFKTI